MKLHFFFNPLLKSTASPWRIPSGGVRGKIPHGQSISWRPRTHRRMGTLWAEDEVFHCHTGLLLSLRLHFLPLKRLTVPITSHRIWGHNMRFVFKHLPTALWALWRSNSPNATPPLLPSHPAPLPGHLPPWFPAFWIWLQQQILLLVFHPHEDTMAFS